MRPQQSILFDEILLKYRSIEFKCIRVWWLMWIVMVNMRKMVCVKWNFGLAKIRLQHVYEYRTHARTQVNTPGIWIRAAADSTPKFQYEHDYYFICNFRYEKSINFCWNTFHSQFTGHFQLAEFCRH